MNLWEFFTLGWRVGGNGLPFPEKKLQSRLTYFNCAGTLETRNSPSRSPFINPNREIDEEISRLRATVGVVVKRVQLES